MTMAHCDGCGNDAAMALQIGHWKDESGQSVKYCICDRCGNVSGAGAGTPDVYFPGIHKDPNIVDKMGNEILLESRRHKADLMRERGMREANDRWHGGPGHHRFRR